MSISGTRSASEWSRRLVASLAEQGAFTSEEGASALVRGGGAIHARGDRSRRARLRRAACRPRRAGAAVRRQERRHLRGAADGRGLQARPRDGRPGERGDRLPARERPPRRSQAPSLSRHEVLRGLSDFLGIEIAGYVLADPIGIEQIMDAVYPRMAGGASATAHCRRPSRRALDGSLDGVRGAAASGGLGSTAAASDGCAASASSAAPPAGRTGPSPRHRLIQRHLRARSSAVAAYPEGGIPGAATVADVRTTSSRRRRPGTRPRRAVDLRGRERRIRPPPRQPASADDPGRRRAPPDRRPAPARQRADPGDDLPDPHPGPTGSASKRRRSSTPPT